MATERIDQYCPKQHALKKYDNYSVKGASHRFQ